MYSFGEIIGNEALVKRVKNAVSLKKTPHAYIIAGRDGSGKTLLAKTIAKAMQCPDKTNGEPCLNCVSCRTFDSGNHPDVIYVHTDGKKSLGIDVIREQIGDNILTKPYKYEHKIFILEDAGAMTPQAQNAFLKTLEEPAGYGFFLLTSNGTGNFLPTVLSRAAVLKIKPVPDEAVKKYLLRNGFTEDEAEICSAHSGGSVGRALRLKEDEKFTAAREFTKSVIEALTVPENRNSPEAAFALAQGFEPFKDNIAETLGMLYGMLKDVLIFKSSGDAGKITERGAAGLIKEAASLLSVNEILNKLDAVNETIIKLRYNANFKMAADAAALQLLD